MPKAQVVMWIDLTLYGTATRLDNFSRCRLYGQVAAENRFRVDERSGVDRFGQHYAVRGDLSLDLHTSATGVTLPSG